MKKIAFFAFKGEKMCFTHILFNAIDLHKKGNDVKIVIEGMATKAGKILLEEENPLMKEAIELNLIDAVCYACAKQMEVLDYYENKTNLTLNRDLIGHPPMEPYIKNGYEIITL